MAMEQLNLLTIPIDVLRLILDECERHPGSLFSFVQICKSIHAVVLPILYQKVDLSVHNRGLVSGSQQWTPPRPGDYPAGFWADDTDHNTSKNWPPQATFLRTLFKHPSYGAYVHSFSWTIIWTLYLLRDLGVGLISSQWTRPKLLYHVWSLLTNVQHVDLASIYKSVYYVDDDIRECVPKTLFASATSIRLLGWMPRSLITAILVPKEQSIRTVLLQRLSLDGLQFEGSNEFNKPVTEEEYKTRRGVYDTATDYIGNGLCCPGPVYNILPGVLSRCRATLTHLELRKPGQEILQGHGLLWSSQIDESIYAEWAGFLETVCHSLVSLTLEQAKPHREIGNEETDMESQSPGWRFNRPMDKRFMEFVYPALVAASWPKLSRMIIRGVANHASALDQKAIDILRSALEPHTLLVIDVEPSRPCRKFSGY